MSNNEGIVNFRSYNGNPTLKRTGVGVEWTEERIVEWEKCARDPIYFCEKYMKVVHLDKGLVEFKLRDYQKEIIKSIHDNRYTIVCTARQSGKSVSLVGFMVWYVLFNENKTIGLLANKGDTAREILGRVQLAYQHLPKWIQQGIVEWNKGSFVLENGSRILAAASSASAIRGWSLNCLMIDEAAFVENWDTFFNSVFPTISSGETTKIVLVSTPNGLNHFHKTWELAGRKGQEDWNGYNRIFVNWSDVPGRDERWKKETLATMNFDMDRFAQEYCGEFLGSSGTLIAGWKLKELVHSTPNVTLSRDGMSLFKSAVKGNTYTITADVSEGKGLDYSCFSVIDVTKMPYEQVCSYRSNLITPVEFAEKIASIGKIYNNATVLIEFENMGPVVANHLYSELEYENVLFTESAGVKGKKITAGFRKNVDMGLPMSRSVKASGCSILKLLIEQNQLIINDHVTISELSTFSKNGISYEAESGHHDDAVMALVVFAWLSNQQYFRDYTNINTMNALRDKTLEDIENELVPFGFIYSGENELKDNIIEPFCDYSDQFRDYSDQVLRF